ncbi:metal ABC transporter solute-binding protein, Zn/Mn family [Gordonia sp. NPDC003424]
MNRRTLWSMLAVLGAGILVLAGCSGGGDDKSGDSGGKPTVVTSTDVWGAVASAVAGDAASVTSLYTTADGDPHEFEPSAADTAKIADADVVVLNGGHYDQYMEDAISGSDATVVNAYDLLYGEHAEDHDSDDHGAHNEHVFYDLSVAGLVATKVADALATKDPAGADTFRANATTFNTQITELRGQLAGIKKAHDGTKVAQTEPLAGYLLTEAGLVDIAPESFTAAVEDGQSPSAADRAAMEDLLRSHTAHALIYNTQAVDPVTEALLSVAKSANVAVVKFSETLPDGVTSYIDWQRSQIESLSSALAAPAS